METKEIKITPPEGYEIDKENSTFECIKFKKKSLTYGDVTRELFKNKRFFYIKDNGVIESNAFTVTLADAIYNSNNATSKKQLEKLLAINKLLNTSVFLNNGWKPDWSNEREHKFYIGIEEKEIYVNDTDTNNESFCYFKCPALAQRAIDILGEDTIRLALSTDW